MPKIAKTLTAIQVARLTKPGSYAVGVVSGLNLLVKDGGSRSWILRLSIGGKRKELGLGPFPEVTLAQAHEKARALKETARSGVDPLAQRRQAQAHVEWTFERCAEEYIKLHRPSWKNAKHAQQWVNTLATYAQPVIGHKHVRDVTVGDVLAVIEPHWLSKNETMVRVQQRIELVLGWAAARGYRSKDNPAQWRGNLQHTLPKPSKVNARQHHKALPWQQAKPFWQALAQSDSMSAKALQWVMLTACRSGEARGATWDEVDMDAAVWVVPASRMKAGREHRVPLCPQALELLASVPRFQPPEGLPDYIFPGRSGGQLSDMTLTQMMRRMAVDAVPHGLRSTFADWAAENTTAAAEVRELCLAHSIGNETQAAYTRTDMMERRRTLMEQWAGFLVQPEHGLASKVISISAKAA